MNIISRRNFLQTAALTGAGLALGPSLFGKDEVVDKNWKSPHANLVSPDKKVRLAVIGCGGQGGVDANIMAGGVQFAAFADVDYDRASAWFLREPNVPRYRDYRKMLDEQKDNIDAVLIATPDHTHFPAAVMAMNLGKHVYVEKPATHTIGDARYLKALAKKTRPRLRRLPRVEGMDRSGCHRRRYRSSYLDKPTRLAAGCSKSRSRKEI